MEKDFRKFFKSRHPYGMTAFDAMMSNPSNSLTPYILEEREMNLATLDIYSKMLYERTIFFGHEVNSETSNLVISQLLYLESTGDEPIKLMINSPGGEIISGMGIVSTMEFIKPEVHTINVAMAASMGSILLAAGEKGHRSALKYSRVLLHQPLGGAKGQCSDIMIEAELISKMRTELFTFLSERTGQPFEKIMKDGDRDYWLTAPEALEYGIVDKIIDKSTEK